MSAPKYLIYLDILGFQALAAEIADKKGLHVRGVRSTLIGVIKERVKTVREKGRILGQKYGESDDWLIVTESFENALRCIHEILDHDTGYGGCEQVPMEIAIRTAEYDERAHLDGSGLIVEDPTVTLLKTHILYDYHTWYKNEFQGKSPNSTFVLVDERTYADMEPLDQKWCRPVEHTLDEENGEKRVTRYFVADVNKIRERGALFDFLDKIDHPGSKWYGRIDDVYVSPVEYEDIKASLQKERILFICRCSRNSPLGVPLNSTPLGAL